MRRKHITTTTTTATLYWYPNVNIFLEGNRDTTRQNNRETTEKHHTKVEQVIDATENE